MTSPSQDRLFGTNSSMAIKVPCRVATTADITLEGEQTIDGVAVVSGDRVLVKDQSDGTENGIYIADTSEWQRAPDFDGSRDVTAGTLVKVNNGTAGQGFWYVTTTGTIVVGTTSIAFGQASTVLAVISAFVQTLLDDADASTFMTSLGFSTYFKTLVAAASAAALRLLLGFSAIAAKGDLWVGTAADTVGTLTAGSVDGMTLQKSAAAATGLAWDYNAVVQRGYAEYTTNADLSTTIPADDTIPQQSTEGTLIASVTITPKSASNRIRIRCQGFMSGPNTAGGALAVFQDSTADAIAATLVTFSTAAPTVQICLEFEVSAASTSARTYKLHAGGTSTVRMNGSTAGRYFGGVAKTTMVVEEIKG